mmetsp:Transcript_11912/g.29170  ORF Transcript_11912/g.29170 Transcript_11912/m.29170 type:complete len:490 (-) Transcript_11912:55-1524(-)
MEKKLARRAKMPSAPPYPVMPTPSTPHTSPQARRPATDTPQKCLHWRRPSPLSAIPRQNTTNPRTPYMKDLGLQAVVFGLILSPVLAEQQDAARVVADLLGPALPPLHVGPIPLAIARVVQVRLPVSDAPHEVDVLGLPALVRGHALDQIALIVTHPSRASPLGLQRLEEGFVDLVLVRQQRVDIEHLPDHALGLAAPPRPDPVEEPAPPRRVEGAARREEPRGLDALLLLVQPLGGLLQVPALLACTVHLPQRLVALVAAVLLDDGVDLLPHALLGLQPLELHDHPPPLENVRDRNSLQPSLVHKRLVGRHLELHVVNPPALHVLVHDLLHDRLEYAAHGALVLHVADDEDPLGGVVEMPERDRTLVLRLGHVHRGEFGGVRDGVEELEGHCIIGQERVLRFHRHLGRRLLLHLRHPHPQGHPPHPVGSAAAHRRPAGAAQQRVRRRGAHVSRHGRKGRQGRQGEGGSPERHPSRRWGSGGSFRCGIP